MLTVKLISKSYQDVCNHLIIKTKNGYDKIVNVHDTKINFDLCVMPHIDYMDINILCKITLLHFSYSRPNSYYIEREYGYDKKLYHIMKHLYAVR